MTILRLSLVAGALLAAAVAGVATSQQQPPSPVAATQTDLPRSRTDAAALAQARQDPLGERLRGVLSQQPETAAVLGQVQTSTVPVLAPADPALLRTARFYGGAGHYMLVVERAGQSIEVYGSTKAFQSPVSRPAVAPAPAPAARLNARGPGGAAVAMRRAQATGLADVRTEQTEYGVDVTFSRFGAVYNVSFICEAQAAPGCTEADAVTFAAGLTLIGGGA